MKDLLAGFRLVQMANFMPYSDDDSLYELSLNGVPTLIGPLELMYLTIVG